MASAPPPRCQTWPPRLLFENPVKGSGPPPPPGKPPPTQSWMRHLSSSDTGGAQLKMEDAGAQWAAGPTNAPLHSLHKPRLSSLQFKSIGDRKWWAPSWPSALLSHKQRVSWFLWVLCCIETIVNRIWVIKQIVCVGRNNSVK